MVVLPLLILFTNCIELLAFSTPINIPHEWGASAQGFLRFTIMTVGCRMVEITQGAEGCKYSPTVSFSSDVAVHSRT